ncbi:MAG TPA: T9SS type A sorting domain-containing protein [Bacteroidia bacterium]|nr:T9SS type A sorting domain-containing protein [Bacteroidia bacterium]
MTIRIFSLPILMFLFINYCSGQQGEWVWIHGDAFNNSGNFGTQGVPASTNNPPPLYEPCEWTDLNGNFWLYGGLRAGAGCNGFCVYNDLWKYDPLTNEWTWMKGTGIPNDTTGDYGVQGVPAITNQPPCRSWGAQSWVDLSGNLWMFGGEDNNTIAPYGFSDLWKYDIAANMWTWMKGPNIPGQFAVYGVMGVPNILNNPPSSVENAAAWTSNSGDLYLLEHSSNALWKYNIASNMWTWIKGPNQLHFGIKGVEDPLNNPGGSAYSRWKDNNGFFWKFDGGGILWRYNDATNNWTWMSGDSTYIPVSNYGTKCIPSPQNLPCGRNEGRAVWKDSNGNFWLFGGYSFFVGGGLSDMWMYNVSSNQWTWAAGDSTLNANANYGTLGVSSPSNNPGYKEGAVGWSDNNGHLYLFGGSGIGSGWYTNALWKFTIDTLCAPLSNEEITDANREVQVYPNPATGELTITIHRNNIEKADFILFNVLGEQVFSETENFIKDSFTKKINITNLAQGIYILQINMDSRIVARKIEKK